MSSSPEPVSRSVILFGPQSTEFQADRLRCMREVLSTCPSLRSLHDDILHLESFGRYLKASDSNLNSTRVVQSSSVLADWIQGNGDSVVLEALEQQGQPNALITPLTVLSQILLYFQHWTNYYLVENRIPITPETTAAGLCVGQLAAAAVRWSIDENEFARRASMAVKLAVCIGVYVDLDRRLAGNENEARCLVVSLRGSRDGVEQIRAILGNYKTAYISVYHDSKVTITVGKAQASSVARRLFDRGFRVREMNLFGRFHCSSMSGAVQKILELYNRRTDLQLDTPNALREMLDSIMTVPQDWRSTMAKMLENRDYNLAHPVCYSIGENTISPSLAKELGLRVGATVDDLSTTRIDDRLSGKGSSDPPASFYRNLGASSTPSYPEDAVAVTGMACKFAGADSLEEFWNILERGKTMYRDLPKDRFPDARFERREFSRNFKGNTLDNVDAFDHSFFRVPSREATFMDPQQRLGLQVLYQALEVAGYFEKSQSERERDIGCYMASCMNEYAENVSTHPPSAFSLTGSVRPFVSGKLSHYFGWTGPSMMLDTACAASGAAVHQACRAVASGECAGAVAGGTNIFVSPDTFQNLAAGHFTSPTGPSRPFDAAADGYCRGEGVAFVVLKKLSAALRDGDPIRGVIMATAVGQNANEHGITVPHGPSQRNLYRKALRQAGMDARDVSYVEAHGTGTPVGDPIEADSIRGVFGNPATANDHEKPIYLGSLKSNIGHTEATSGLSGLIKVLLMMEKGVIPQQALFNNLNPNIGPLEPHGIKIATRNVPWNSEFKAACVNNYGASGSIAVMVVAQPPDQTSLPSWGQRHPRSTRDITTLPISITASTPSSLTAYCSALLDFLGRPANPDTDDSVMDAAYNLSLRKNPSLPCSIEGTVSSMVELKNLLASAPQAPRTEDNTPRPVVLFFSGQTGRTASTPRAYYDSSATFRKHLDDCDATLRALGIPNIFPVIFGDPVVQHDDLVLLHAALFSGQYASAIAWLNCGLRPARLIGHSFGQLTALCVSGVLTLHDGLRLVIERARLIQEHMFEDPGVMMAVEADPDFVSDLLRQHNAHHPRLDIACYNGPRNTVVAGNISSMEAFEAFLNTTPEPIRRKMLHVTHGYHSTLTEPVVVPLEHIAQQLNIRAPTIPLETCSGNESWRLVTPALIASHTREPVYFHQAVERVSEELGPCTWLEIGSRSGAAMLRRALEKTPAASSHEIRSHRMDPASSLEPLAEVTAELWKLGVRVRYWPFHPIQRHHYRMMNLPPYQFDKSHFWLGWKDLGGAPTVENDQPAEEQLMPVLRLVRKTEDRAEYQVNTKSESWKTLCSDYQILGVPVCPLSSLLDLVSQAIDAVEGSPNWRSHSYNLQHLTMERPLPAESEHEFTLVIINVVGGLSWSFAVEDLSSTWDYASGTVSTRWATKGGPSTAGDFARFERLADLPHIKSISHHEDTNAVKGKAVYRTLSNFFSVPGARQAVREVSFRGNEAIGYLKSACLSPSTAIEACLQIPLLCLQCLHDREEDDIIRINTEVGGAYFRDCIDLSLDCHWIVLAKFCGLRDPERATCDLFVFDAESEQLSIIILDVGFSMAITDNLQESLRRQAKVVTRRRTEGSGQGFTEPSQTPRPNLPSSDAPDPAMSSNDGIATPATASDGPDVTKALFDLLVRVADIEPHRLRDDVSVVELGIDSLMGMEVAEEISKLFFIYIDGTELLTVRDLGALCRLIAGRRTIGLCNNSRSSQSDESAVMVERGGPRSPSTSTSTPEHPSGERGVERAAGHSPVRPQSDVESLDVVLRAFDSIREEFDIYAKETGCDNFLSQVHPRQTSLIVAYITEAFAKLGCDLSYMEPDQPLPNVSHTARNNKLVMRLMLILRHEGLITQDAENAWVRTGKPLSVQPSSSERYDQLLAEFPRFAPEHKLLHLVGPQLDGCLSGAINPLALLFGSREKRQIMADQYFLAPIQSSASRQLASFIGQCFHSQRTSPEQPLRVLEIGAGTCGTSLYAVEAFAQLGIPVEYTFSDISPSFVAEAKTKLGEHRFVIYRILDITQDPPPELRHRYDMVFATNTIHATPDASRSARNAREMLRPGGFLALVEYTQTSYYLLDMVFGQLDGWWAFNDGRDHALMDVDGWKATLLRAGFRGVDWTGSQSQESKILRIILAY